MHNPVLRGLLCLCLLGPLQAEAAVLSDSSGFKPLWPELELLLDPLQSWQNPDQLPSSGWQLGSQRVPSFGPSNNAYWFRTRLENQSQQNKWFLHLDFPLLEQMDFYIRYEGEDTWQKFASGRFVPRAQRAVADMMPSLPLQLNPGTYVDVILHVKTRTTVQLPLFVATEENLQHYNNSQLANHFIFIGMMLALILYNLFLFLAIRQAAFGYYVVYLTSLCFYILSMKGMGPLLIWTENRPLELSLIILAMGLTPLFAALFVRHFLRIDKYAPELRSSIKILLISSLVSIPLGWAGFYFVWVKLATLNALAFSLLMLVAGIIAWRRGNQSATYFLLAWCMIIISTFTYAGLINGLLPYNQFTSNIMEIGTASEALLLSLALADAIRRIRKAKLKAQELAALEVNAANRALQKVVEALEMSNAEKDEFLRIASHELRTPMHALTASLDLLRKNPDEHQYLESLQVGSSMLNRHVENMVAYCELNTDKLAHENINFDLTELLNELALYCKSQLKGRPVQFILETDAQLPQWLRGDRLNLQRLLLNLLDNACKFTPAGHVTLAVHLLHREENNVYLNFSVQDSGQGVDEALQHKLFQLFSMADRSMTRRQSGLGLGLAVSAKLAQHLNSFLHFDSSPRAGTLVEFKVTLDLGHGPNVVPIKRSHILVVEDNHTNAMLLCKMLTKLGHSSDVAADGAIALQKLAEQTYDAILMDCQMPIMDGWQVTRAIRDSETPYQKIPIIAVTANASSEDRARCHEAGMDDFLQKPLRLATLDDALHRWLTPSQKTG